MRAAILRSLEAIPSHRETPLSPEQVALLVAQGANISLDASRGITECIVTILDAFGTLEWTGDACRMKDQVPNYFRNSLGWYLSSKQYILSNWQRTGTARDIRLGNLLDNAPHLLKAMEERRLELSKKNNLSVTPVRFQPCAITLIKTITKQSHLFLHQWDDRAEQYQLIGGRQRPNELPIDTAKRELHEELSQHDLSYGRDYSLSALNESPIEDLCVSRTYGALTAYTYFLYHVTFRIPRLMLGGNDRWITLEEMTAGKTRDEKKIRDPHLLNPFDISIAGGLKGLPASTEFAVKDSVLEYMEVKPSIFGLITIDLKGLILNWRARRRLKQ